MSTRTLPLRPNLDQLKIQANELHRAHRERQPSAAARIAAHHPEMKGLSLQAVLAKPLALADAQLVVAREYGFDNWAQLKHRVELGSRIDEIKPHPRFADALAALDAGDVDRLRSLIASDPSLVHGRLQDHEEVASDWVEPMVVTLTHERFAGRYERSFRSRRLSGACWPLGERSALGRWRSVARFDGSPR